jgi:toxin HigB-1
MIKSWQHKGLKLFYETGNTSKIQAKHADKLHDILQILDVITNPEQLRLPGLEFHTAIPAAPLNGCKYRT